MQPAYTNFKRIRPCLQNPVFMHKQHPGGHFEFQILEKFHL